MTQFSKTLDSLLEGLSERQRKVIIGRFGLDGKGKVDRETLEAIGKIFGITRERVRQIEAASLKIIAGNAKENLAVQSLLKDAKRELRDAGGVMLQEKLVENLAAFYEGLTENHMALLLGALHAFEFHPGDETYRPFYYLDKESFRKGEAFISQWAKFLRSQKPAVLEGAYFDKFKEFAKEKKVPLPQAENYMAISHLIHKNSFGDIGLAEWPEINPKTIRDRIHLVLRKKKQPVHFTDIAKLINEAKLDDKVALASTVHNELIKDPRFVLVGRGMYALAEHGYEPGTAQEVIKKILRREGPLRSDDIVLAVQKERLFKHNTILVNLQNKALFERLDDGRYKSKEA